MTPMQPRTGRLDDHDIRNMAAKALDKIISATKPKLVVWDVMNRRLRVISATAGYAKDWLKKPTCLGMYDFDVSLQDIIDDFKAVYQRG